jgi:hypothetical protein
MVTLGMELQSQSPINITDEPLEHCSQRAAPSIRSKRSVPQAVCCKRVHVSDTQQQQQTKRAELHSLSGNKGKMFQHIIREKRKEGERHNGAQKSYTPETQRHLRSHGSAHPNSKHTNSGEMMPGLQKESRQLVRALCFLIPDGCHGSQPQKLSSFRTHFRALYFTRGLA